MRLLRILLPIILYFKACSLIELNAEAGRRGDAELILDCYSGIVDPIAWTENQMHFAHLTCFLKNSTFIVTMLISKVKTTLSENMSYSDFFDQIGGRLHLLRFLP